MACGDKYRHLLKTVDGRGPSNPCWAFCGVGDYDETRDVLLEIAAQVWKRWEYVLSTEAKLEAMPVDKRPVASVYPERDQVLFLVQDFAKKLEANPHPLIESANIGELTWSPAVARAWAAAEDGICVMERLDDVAAYYDAKPLPGPTGKTTPAGGIGVVGWAALGLGAWWLISRRRSDA